MSQIAVLDACVLVPASLRDTLLDSALAGLYTPCLSADILIEVERAVSRLTGRRDSGTRLRAAIEAVFPGAIVSGYEPLIDTMSLPDTEDRHVLAAAVHATADVIVTANLRHFPSRRLEPLGVVAQHPDEFLLSILSREEGRILEILERQSARLRYPPKSVEDVLGALKMSVPRFARAVSDRRLSNN